MTLIPNNRYRPNNAPTTIAAGWCTARLSAAPTAMQNAHAVTATPLIFATPILLMTSSPASRFLNQFAQLFDQILDHKASCSCTSNTISNNLRQLPRALHFSASYLLRADERARSLMG